MSEKKESAIKGELIIIGPFPVLRLNSPNCPCGATPDKHEVKNHDPIWHDGDVCCTVCGRKVRDYDAG